jgi:transposase InsO family protein
MSGEHTIEVLCETLEVSRSGYYAWRGRSPSPRARASAGLAERVRAAHAASRGTYGSPRIARQLGCPGARHRVARLMRADGLQGRSRRRFRVVTTDSRHDEPIAPNHLAQAPAPSGPDQIWVTDITYIPTDEGWLYVAGVLDLWSRRLIGWAMGDSLDTSLPSAALAMALRQRRPKHALLHHSDRGVQYASRAYRAQLAAHRLHASMSRKGNCYDNATMEAFWSTLKNELVHRTRFVSRDQARLAIFDYIEVFYNRVRIHSSLGFKSPLDYESNLN